jgi:NADH dehydrogenase FAD-containing subunit
MHRIVVVGGGVAGIVTATHLSRRLTRSKLADILLVDHNLAQSGNLCCILLQRELPTTRREH